jgi:hypothetical protein
MKRIFAVLVALTALWLTPAWATQFTVGTAPSFVTGDNGVVSDGAYFYKIGDFFSGANGEQIERYDPTGDSWSTLTAAPTSLEGTLPVAYLDGKIYVLPWALTGTPNVSALYIYDVVGDSWDTGADHPGDAWAAGLVAWNGKLYKVGGSDGSGSAVADLVEYDPDADTWTPLASMATARFFHATFVYDGQIYVFGGVAAGGLTELASGEVYDIESDTWSAETALPGTLWGGGYATLDGVFYLVGGVQLFVPLDAGYLRDIEAGGAWGAGHDLTNVTYRFRMDRVGDTLYMASNGIMEYLTLSVSAPTLVSINPASGDTDTNVAVEVIGDHFVPDNLTLSLELDGDVIAATDVLVYSASRLTGQFDLTSAAPGAYDVVVENDFGLATLEDAFEVTGEPADDDDDNDAADDDAADDDAADDDAADDDADDDDDAGGGGGDDDDDSGCGC